MKSTFGILCFFILSYACMGQDKGALKSDFYKNFVKPPQQARPKIYWWWLNGDVDTVRLKEELRAMKNAGISGVDIFEIGVSADDNPGGMIKAGPPFMGPGFLKSLKVALDEAYKLDMEAGMSVASSWNAGGSWVKPEHAAKTLYSSKTELGPASEKGVKLPFPEISPNDPRGRSRLISYDPDKRPVYYQEVTVLAIPKSGREYLDTTDIVDVTSFFDKKTEKLNWLPASGNWEIYRYICANSGEHLFLPSPNSVGPIIDHYDSLATAEHLRYFIDRLKPLVGGNFSRSALKYLYLASYEATDFAWSAGVPEKFLSLNGYPVQKFIPALFNGKKYRPEIMENFRHDLRKTFSEMMISNHYQKAKEICNANGLKIISEAGGPGVYNIPVETLKALGALDIPRGEFWHKTVNADKDGIDKIWLVKEIAAASHIYKQGIVEEEAFTTTKSWQESPAELKIIADRAFCEGMNRLVIHGFPHNPKRDMLPGIGYFAGIHYNDKQTWWPAAKPFHDYLARISYVLQNARFVADVLYYYGEDIPNLVPPKNTRFTAGKGYDYEIINTEVMLRDLKVANREWVLPGVGRYKVLSIGSGNRIGPEVKKRLAEWQKQGGVIAELDIAQLLKTPPDFQYKNEAAGTLDFIHYQKESLDFYLVRNTTGKWISEHCRFRQSNAKPEIWDPVSGEAYAIDSYKNDSNFTDMDIILPPFGSSFVVFDKNPASPAGTSGGNVSYYFSAPNQTDTLKTKWQVAFSEKRGGPKSVEMNTLQSWTKSEVDGLRYYSGSATYTTKFDIDKESKKSARRIFLDLGDLSAIATVWVNGKPLGTTWTPPFRYEISGAMKTGQNDLKIEIGNNWSNRIIGDAVLNQQYASTNLKTSSWGKNGMPWNKTALTPSGLFGPVTILYY
ncbi:glycosyl hydrolase [Dyadobacter bucti]|uniref:glycosyl hydrolase n=1 Tax=Dyadobacter bucti TaxID=2572203 RepID=UPI003F723054